MMFSIYKKASTLISILLVSLLAHVNLAIAGDATQSPGFELIEKMETYTDRSAGFSIGLLEDYGLSSEQGDLLFFGSPDRAGTVIIRPRPGLAVSTLQATLRNGFDNDVIVLAPTGSPMPLELDGGKGLAMEVQGTIQGREVNGIVAGVFGENDQGFMILAGIVRERWPAYKQTALTMIQSFAVKPRQPGFEYERWEKRLNGRRLVYAEGYGGRFRGGIYIGEFHFCSDGTFRRRSDSMHTESYGWSRYSSGTSSKSRGTWQVRIQNNNPRILVRPKRGSVEFLDLEENSGYLFLNGSPYRVAVNELCE